MKIHYINAICGGGKTTALLRHHSKFGQHTLLVQPTINLIKGTANTYTSDFIKGKGEVYPIYKEDKIFRLTETDSRPVYERFNEHSGSIKKNKGQSLTLMTHAALLKAPMLFSKDKFDLVIDETLPIDNHIPITLTINFQRLCENVEAIPSENIQYLKLVAKNGCKTKIKHLAEYAHTDTMEEAMSDFWNAMASEDTDVYVRKSQWKAFTSKSPDRYKMRLDIHSILKPDVLKGWKSVRIMAANFTDSFMYSIWSHLGVEWQEEKNIKPEHTEHQATNRMTVHYMSDQRNTRYLQDEKTGQNNLRKIVHHNIKSLFGSNEFIWFHNNRHDEDYIDSPKGIRVSNYAHGLNEYRHINNAVFLSALNNRLEHIQFLHDVFGFDKDEIYKARAYESAYQCIMRTSMRLPDATDEVNVLVIDRGLAEYIAQLIPGTKVYVADKQITIANETKTTKKIAMSATERKQKERKQQKQLKDKQEQLLSQMSHYVYNIEPYRDISDSNHPLTFSLFLDLDRKGYIEEQYTNWDSLFEQLSEWHEAKIENKKDAPLISPAKFDINKSNETNYGLDNLEFINSIWLDIDDGDLEPEDVEYVLGEIHDIKHIIFNSYSHNTKKVPNGYQDGKPIKKYISDSSSNSFRVMIPLLYPVVSEVAELLWDQLVKLITEEALDNERFFVGREKDLPVGWKFSGIDRSKRTPVSMFYVPTKAHPKGKSFFNCQYWLDKPFLNPIEVIKTNSVHEIPEFIEEKLYVKHSESVKKLTSLLKRGNGMGTLSPEHEAQIKEGKRKRAIDDAEHKWITTSVGEHNDMFSSMTTSLYRTKLFTDQELIQEVSRIGSMYSKEYGHKRATKMVNWCRGKIK